MKKLFIPLLVGLSATMLLTGCIGAQGRTTIRTQTPTVGQELIDLQKAKDEGVITEAEYQAQKARLLANK
jgi:hypothetical protein